MLESLTKNVLKQIFSQAIIKLKNKTIISYIKESLSLQGYLLQSIQRALPSKFWEGHPFQFSSCRGQSEASCPCSELAAMRS